MTTSDSGCSVPCEEFMEDTDAVAGLVTEERAVPLAEQKGALTELVLILSTRGAGSAVINLIKLWLERDQKRSVELPGKNPEEPPFTVRGSGEKISLGLLEETARRLSRAQLRRGRQPGEVAGRRPAEAGTAGPRLGTRDCHHVVSSRFCVLVAVGDPGCPVPLVRRRLIPTGPSSVRSHAEGSS
ncbi:hypothetical protein [Streptomyces lonegramiae]|uniref:Uncharacterized protein n=1 Tax=Streptomyces lonegramiae TaxID=3075524 RepID=A0ABU2XWW4_9ACTN|nr:hypothetical protein [Streptomyces sp. DSM 41529]MDT0549959.1 hypothetical protein [Streptomyces sp. DSM 41529]